MCIWRHLQDRHEVGQLVQGGSRVGVDLCVARQVFVRELLVKLQGLQKQEDLHNDGIDLPQLHIYPTRSGSADREALH